MPLFGADTGSALGVGIFLIWIACLVAFSLVAVAAVGLSVWMVVDASRRPDHQFASAGVDRTLWIVLASVGLMLCQPLGLVASIIYFTSVRPRLDAIPPAPSPPISPTG